jgi:hypothetical protein
MRKLSSIAAVAGAAVLLFAVGITDARTVAKGSSSGQYAIASASGTINNPGTIRVEVTSSPSESVLVSWTMVCSHGLSAGTKSGQFKAHTTVLRTIPKPMEHPSQCIVSMNAQLQGNASGVIRVSILD